MITTRINSGVPIRKGAIMDIRIKRIMVLREEGVMTGDRISGVVAWTEYGIVACAEDGIVDGVQHEIGGDGEITGYENGRIGEKLIGDCRDITDDHCPFVKMITTVGNRGEVDHIIQTVSG